MKGALLGLANTVVITFGIGSIGDYPGLIPTMLIAGTIVGVPTGFGLGALADLLSWHRHLRLLLLAAVALLMALVPLSSFVLLTDGQSHNQELLFPCIPTFVAAVILERWTRHAADPQVPTAAIAPATRT